MITVPGHHSKMQHRLNNSRLPYFLCTISLIAIIELVFLALISGLSDSANYGKINVLLSLAGVSLAILGISIIWIVVRTPEPRTVKDIRRQDLVNALICLIIPGVSFALAVFIIAMYFRFFPKGTAGSYPAWADASFDVALLVGFTSFLSFMPSIIAGVIILVRRRQKKISSPSV